MDNRKYQISNNNPPAGGNIKYPIFNIKTLNLKITPMFEVIFLYELYKL